MNDTNDQPCPICYQPAKVELATNRSDHHVECPLCGKYKLTGLSFFKEQGIDIWKLSSAIRFRSDKGIEVSLNINNFKSLVDDTNFPEDPYELIDLLLLFLYNRSPYFGYRISVHMSKDFPAICVPDSDQFSAIADFAKELGYAEFVSNQTMRIRLGGWERINELKHKAINSKKVFVAMWFDKTMDDAYLSGISEAIKSCAYVPERIDFIEHNNDIMYQILASIRQSKFVVADYTGNRGGVYYEAGFAYGLGKQVIPTCNKYFFENEKVHFDVNHNNFIVWSDVEDLKKKLTNRIKATILPL